MCIRDRSTTRTRHVCRCRRRPTDRRRGAQTHPGSDRPTGCLLYTSDAADERSSVDLGGRRIIKKKKR